MWMGYVTKAEKSSMQEVEALQSLVEVWYASSEVERMWLL